MGNSWFQFQQFKIEQGRSAMKVCTDSCLFATSIPCHNSRRILDVGAGTGLIGLMLAQKNPEAILHFIEPDSGSFLDLLVNTAKSPWKDRCLTINIDLENWAAKNPEPYDLVVSNPPFFLNHLQSPDIQRNQSMHLGMDGWKNWVMNLNKLLSPFGELWILLPGGISAEKMLDAFQIHEISPFKILEIKQMGKPFRTFAGLKRTQMNQIEKAHLELRNPDGNLAKWALELMKDYYLVPPTDSVKP